MDKTLTLREQIASLNHQDFANLGLYELAYIHPQSDGLYSIYSASGQVIAHCPTFETAHAVLIQNGLENCPLH